MRPGVDNHLFERQLRPILASIGATTLALQRANDGGPSGEDDHRPFLTISRQPGAGAWTLARRLVERLNASDPGGPPWTCWDKELVEKVAGEHHISSDLVQSLGERSRSWLEDALAGLSNRAEYADEFTVYRRVAQTIRALAQAGRVVIVGRGGVHITRGMPGGIHLRLVAPLPYRVASMARSLGMPESKAAGVVHDMERARVAFHHRYWPREPLIPEAFTAVLNTEAIGELRLCEWLATLVSSRRQQATGSK